MLFANSQTVGTFKGFNEKGLEFAADIVAPYDANMLDRPQLGQFLLIELGSQEEAALGRITRFVPTGLLATAEGRTTSIRGNAGLRRPLVCRSKRPREELRQKIDFPTVPLKIDPRFSVGGGDNFVLLVAKRDNCS